MLLYYTHIELFLKNIYAAWVLLGFLNLCVDIKFGIFGYYFLKNIFSGLIYLISSIPFFF